jgi:hypothetical protein
MGSFLAITALPGQPPAQALSLVAGVCTFENLTVDFVPNLPPVTTTVASAVDVILDADGTCTLHNTVTYTATIHAELAPFPASTSNYTCLGGTATGNFTLTITGYDPHPSFAGTAVWEAGPGVANLAVASGNGEFVGDGAFTRVSTHHVDCLTGGLDSTTYSGVFAFEDPVL